MRREKPALTDGTNERQSWQNVRGLVHLRVNINMKVEMNKSIYNFHASLIVAWIKNGALQILKN